jgi:putative nucleotidyltransferase with HDIG domain
MRIENRSYKENALRASVFALGSILIGVVALRLGFDRTEATAIMILGGILSALAAELPWGGFLYPCDALLVGLSLLTGRFEVALAGVGTAVASASVAAPLGRTLLAGTIRNVTAAVVTVGVWRALIPSWDLLLGDGGRSLRLPMSSFGGWMVGVGAVPAILLGSLAFLVVATVVENLLRSRRKYSFGESWLLNAGRNFHHLLFTMVLGAFIAVAYRDIGIAAFVFFAVPVILTRDALKRSLDLRASRFQALKALSSSVDARDRYTYDHSSRVSRLAGLLAREMGFTETTVELIEGGALLHDIGKLSVDTEILSKPGPLNSDQRAAVQMHPLQSADVVSRVDLLKESMGIVKHHHERPDGQGYPSGLRGHEIPVGARILNVADAFDAMTSDRPYRGRKTVDEALQELRQGSGSEFDAVVVEYLARFLARVGEDKAAMRSDDI